MNLNPPGCSAPLSSPADTDKFHCSCPCWPAPSPPPVPRPVPPSGVPAGCWHPPRQTHHGRFLLWQQR
ncbi:hypothetical protein SEEB0220_05360 [Salmonella enterica subsp. enterica serovar Bareilly str. CFSAN000220]|nr:hypothetical protein SEEB0220_05360 [Salmonella enterica subsp. enterica serovar Bareilly str. CFSAN000220]